MLVRSGTKYVFNACELIIFSRCLEVLIVDKQDCKLFVFFGKHCWIFVLCFYLYLDSTKRSGHLPKGESLWFSLYS